MDPLGFEAWDGWLTYVGGGSLAVFQAADLQAAFHRDETGGEEGGDAEHEALDAVPAAHRLSKHPGVTQAGKEGDRGRRGVLTSYRSPPTVLDFPYLEVMKKGTPRRLKPRSQTARLMVMSSGIRSFLFLQ